MNIYRVIFAENEILACSTVNSMAVFNGIYFYEHKDGKLTYAIIKAETEENAITIANFIRKDASLLFTSKSN